MDINKIDLSSAIYAKTELLQSKFGLHIDQIGELEAEVMDVMKGVSKSSDFVDHIADRMEIDRGKATQIAEEVNKQIFSVIREQMKAASEASTAATVSGVEAAGGFTIEHEATVHHDIGMPEHMSEVHKAEMLSHIEEPKKVAIPMNIYGGRDENELHTEPLVDHLLRRPSVAPVEKVVRQVETAPETPTPTAHKLPEVHNEPPKNLPTSGPDPYREPIR